MKQAFKFGILAFALAAAAGAQAAGPTAAQVKSQLAQQGLVDPYGANELDKASDAAAHAKLLRFYDKIAGNRDDRNEMDKASDRALATRLESQSFWKK